MDFESSLIVGSKWRSRDVRSLIVVIERVDHREQSLMYYPEGSLKKIEKYETFYDFSRSFIPMENAISKIALLTESLANMREDF